MHALRDFESNDKLFITYYGGHGFMNDDRQCVWLSNQRQGAATLQWSSIQTMLEEAECDVLVLLDCCAAASSGGSHGKGVTELIAACGFEAFAPGVGEDSFTRSLIEELKYLSQRCEAITTALLHNKVLARIKKSWNPRYSSNGSQERRKTPIHIHLSDDTKQRCIKLAPLRLATVTALSPHSLQASSSPSSGPSTSASEDVDMIDSQGTSQTSLSEVWPDEVFESPKVLISVALQEDQRLNAEDWLEWLKSIPALAKLVHVEGVFKSDSTLLLLSLPVALWDTIPKDPALTFLAFVRSHNLCDPYHPFFQRKLITSTSNPNDPYDPYDLYSHFRTTNPLPTATSPYSQVSIPATVDSLFRTPSPRGEPLPALPDWAGYPLGERQQVPDSSSGRVQPGSANWNILVAPGLEGLEHIGTSTREKTDWAIIPSKSNDSGYASDFQYYPSTDGPSLQPQGYYRFDHNPQSISQPMGFPPDIRDPSNVSDSVHQPKGLRSAASARKPKGKQAEFTQRKSSVTAEGSRGDLDSSRLRDTGPGQLSPVAAIGSPPYSKPLDDNEWLVSFWDEPTPDW
ncbi:MAG: hypothetical protein Q9226_008935 [Calogaya cf. arnoldii]